MLLVSITTTIPANAGLVWFPMALDAVDLDEVHRVLAEDGVIIGDRLDLSKQPDGTRRVKSRERMIVGRSSIATIKALDVALAA